MRCDHFSEGPLRLLLVGHNPSEHSWRTGWAYSNPSNAFWKLMCGAVLRETLALKAQDMLPKAMLDQAASLVYY